MHHSLDELEQAAKAAGDVLPSKRGRLPIRERLRSWSAENRTPNERLLTDDDLSNGSIKNGLFHTQASFLTLYNADAQQDDQIVLLQDDVLKDIRGAAISASAGDLTIMYDANAIHGSSWSLLTAPASGHRITARHHQPFT